MGISRNPTVRVKEIDGTPDASGITTLEFQNGLVTVAGTKATLANPVGAPTDADYLVGTAQGGLSAEIVVGATPGGELSGTWAAPTVDGTHSGSAHGDYKGLPLALAGATAATRYVGGTASGAPVSGTFAVGDFVIDQTASIYVCTAAGTPGTWVVITGSGGGGTITTKDEGTTLSTTVTTLDFVGAGVTASGAGATTTVTIPGGGGGSGVGDKLYLFANFR